MGGTSVRTDDRKAPSVAIVNQALADRYFPHANAIGKKIWLAGRKQPSTEIMGVVANGRTDDLTHARATGDLSFACGRRARFRSTW